MQRKRHLGIVLGGLLVSLFSTTSAHANQAYPDKPIRFVVGMAAGGALDTGARLVANKMSSILGQPVLIENRPGAGTTIGGSYVASAEPDGYTLFYSGTSGFISPALYKKLRFDLEKSFTPVGGVAWEQLALVVNPSVPAHNTAELIKLFKSKPGFYNVATPGIGTPHHLSLELFNKLAGVQAVHAPYKGAAPIFQDLINGRVHAAIISATSAIPQVRAGKIRVIGVTKETPGSSNEWPPISKDLPGFEAYSSQFILAPKGVPQDVVTKLANALRSALSAEDLKKSFDLQGSVIEHLTPEQMAARMHSELRKWGALVRESGATVD